MAADALPVPGGRIPAPVKYGYSVVGIVEEGPVEALGRRVLCLHPHQDRFIAPEDAVIDVPDDVPDRRATLAANMETAVNGLWDASPGPGDRIVVIGAGVVGSLVAALAARLPGSEVELIDIDPTVKRSRQRWAAAVPRARPEADLVVHAAEHRAGLAKALAIASFEATCSESWYGGTGIARARRCFPRGGSPCVRRRSAPCPRSGGGAVPAAPSAFALSLLRDPVFDLLLSGESAFAALPELMPRLARSPAGVLCHTLRYD
jgi:hypothetical protein